MEKGLNRFKPSEIEEDNINQTRAKMALEQLYGVDIETQEMMSYWDWLFYRDGVLVAIGEYRRRFVDHDTYPDFQFSKKKFDAMAAKSAQDGVPAYMFVEFDDLFIYVKIEGSPETKTMRRNHEVRTEECVVIPRKDYIYAYQLEM